MLLDSVGISKKRSLLNADQLENYLECILSNAKKIYKYKK